VAAITDGTGWYNIGMDPSTVNASTVMVDGVPASGYGTMTLFRADPPFYFINVFLADSAIGTHTLWIKGGTNGVRWAATGYSPDLVAYLAADYSATFDIATCTANPPADTTPPAVGPPVVGFVGSTSMGKTSIPVRASWTATDAVGVVAQQLERQLDGGTWSPVALIAASIRTLSWNATLGHNYAFRIKAQDAAGNWSAWATSATVKPIGYNESSGFIVRRGTWIYRTSTSAWGGHYRTASLAGASARLTFSGRGVAFISRRSGVRGKVRVYVDGTLRATVNLYGVTSWRRVAYVTSWPSVGTHAIKLVVVGTAGHPGVDLDGVVVLR
jgi:hypothetical protein